MNNFKIVSTDELEHLYHLARTELGPNGIGRKIMFLAPTGNKDYTSSLCQVVSYRAAKDPSFFLTLAFPTGENFIILEDVEVAALLPDGSDSNPTEIEMPMVGLYETITELVALINHKARLENSVAARRASFRIV